MLTVLVVAWVTGCFMSISSSGDDTVYRVVVGEYKENYVEVQCIGMYCVDNVISGSYSALEELPQWMQEKVALLMMTSFTPPTKEVEGVGRRINSYTFWVYQ